MLQKLKAVQRIVKNGTSCQVTIPRPILFALEWKPGDFVELNLTEDGTLFIREFRNREYVGIKSPGLVRERLPEPPK